VKIEGIPNQNAERQLDQRNRDPKLDGDDARHQNDSGKCCGKLNRFHATTSTNLDNRG
jgi:hypothetical protein